MLMSPYPLCTLRAWTDDDVSLCCGCFFLTADFSMLGAPKPQFAFGPSSDVVLEGPSVGSSIPLLASWEPRLLEFLHPKP